MRIVCRKWRTDRKGLCYTCVQRTPERLNQVLALIYSESGSEMDIQSIREFIAHGEILKDSVSVPVTIVGKYPRHGSGNVQCTIVIETPNWPPDFGDPLDFQRPIQLEGRTERGDDIWSPEIRITRTTGTVNLSMEGIATFFIEGKLSNFDASKGKTVCVVSLTPTPLALLTDGYYLRKWDGTIVRKGKNLKRRRGIRWRTKLGQAELIESYNYIDEKIGFDSASIQVQRCQIIIKVQTRRRDASLKTFIIELENILEEPLLLLSFLSRRTISWYEANAVFVSKDYSPRTHYNAIARREQNLLYDSEIDIKASRFNVPVKPEALSEGLFQTILATYTQSPLKDTIRQAIQYLLVSYERGYFEAHLGLTYAALESLVDGLSKHNQMMYLMGSSRFDKLSKILEQVIQKEVPDKEIAKGVIDKLPELRRPPIRDRLLKLLEIYKLNKIRMRSDINTALQGILTRRNAYIHTGLVDYDKHFEDFLLLKELIELWILTLLDCPDSAINALAFRKIILAR